MQADLEAFAVPTGAPILEALRIIDESGIGVATVVDADERPVGIVSAVTCGAPFWQE